ncbi:MAG TPA: peroxiredoxin [Dehalococcoidia bacterium]|nr:peroxiredoxin [Dehalococcoidia bacterium]
MLKEGTPAPEFETVLDDGEVFNLASLRGRKNVVLYFYPRDFTPGCTREACTFQENYGEIEKYDAVIVGVSADSLDSHRQFRERHQLAFPLVADPDKKLIRAYEAEGILGLTTARITYVIDKAGIIRAVIRHDFAIGRHLPDVLQALQRIERASVSPTAAN